MMKTATCTFKCLCSQLARTSRARGAAVVSSIRKRGSKVIFSAYHPSSSSVTGGGMVVVGQSRGDPRLCGCRYDQSKVVICRVRASLSDPVHTPTCEEFMFFFIPGWWVPIITKRHSVLTCKSSNAPPPRPVPLRVTYIPPFFLPFLLLFHPPALRFHITHMGELAQGSQCRPTHPTPPILYLE